MKPLIPALLILSACIVKETPSGQTKFYGREFKDDGALIKRIDKQSWPIAYTFTADCPAEFRDQEKRLRDLIIEALQTWLKPLRDHYPDRHFTKNFQLIKHPDLVACKEDRLVLHKNEVDTRVTFDCTSDAGSFATISSGHIAPEVCIRTGGRLDFDPSFLLLHELGHAFGMQDTYSTKNSPSKGGFQRTMGKQPTGVMSGLIRGDQPLVLSQDDKNGIIWLYNYHHENQSVRDCFFPDYTSVGDGRCEPKHPLIFEAKHGWPRYVRQLLRDDPDIDINAGDSQWMTALHHAAKRGDLEIVEALLGHPQIKVNLLNKDRKTATQLTKMQRIIELIENHPTANDHPVPLSVDARDKKITSWGEMKKGD